ncbi:MAG: radical SAM family heme chaperone HemW [Erysipelotrichaceae bacterium]
MVQSLYVHIPFCQHICAYCDFFRCGYNEGLADRFLSALQIDLSNQVKEKQLKTIYIGGGTPSALNINQLETLLLMLKPFACEVKEYTMEANVESLNEEKLMLMKQYGINRISLGVQSLQESLLKIIERKHTLTQIIDCIATAHKVGIHNISIDLIYGLPTQTMKQWVDDLNQVIDHLSITHISLYALSIEENSAFGRSGVKNIDEDSEADMYEMAINKLVNHGFHQYEISSFALENSESQHNKAYWHYDDFYGVGCGASGKLNHQRYDMTRNIMDYINQKNIKKDIILSEKDEMFEYIMMSLRLQEGLSYLHFKELFHHDFKPLYKDIIDELIEKKLCYESNLHLKTTKQGMLFLNDVIETFM